MRSPKSQVFDQTPPQIEAQWKYLVVPVKRSLIRRETHCEPQGPSDYL